MKIVDFKVLPVGRAGNYKIFTLNEAGELHTKEFFNDTESEWEKIDLPVPMNVNKNGWKQ